MLTQLACGNDGKGEHEDNLYLIQTELNPKQY
jgi:hypothetical protein